MANVDSSRFANRMNNMLNNVPAEGITSLYQVKIVGSLGPRWASLLGAEKLRSRESESDLLLFVADQAELMGRLQRIHGHNLQIASVHHLADREV